VGGFDVAIAAEGEFDRAGGEGSFSAGKFK
jgi:hypothetical protein